jgi:CRISPR/Cas system-associated exonuclease Cas4 (RecB family)
LSNAEELAKAIEDRVKGIDAKHLIREPNTFYISELSWCSSKTFFSIKFNTVRVPNEAMIMGRLWHLVLPTLVKDIDEYKDAEFEVEVAYTNPEPKFTIKGRGDIVLSSSDRVEEWKFGLKNITPFDPVIAAYTAQVNEYAYLLNKKQAVLYYVNRRTFSITPVVTEPKETLHSVLVSKAEEIYRCLKNNRVPSNHSPVFDFECKSCPFTIVCPHFLKGIKKQESGTIQDSSAGNATMNYTDSKMNMQASSGTALNANGQNTQSKEVRA